MPDSNIYCSDIDQKFYWSKSNKTLTFYLLTDCKMTKVLATFDVFK